MSRRLSAAGNFKNCCVLLHPFIHHIISWKNIDDSFLSQSCLAEMANGATVTDDSNADGVTSASEDDSETVIFLKARINSLSMVKQKHNINLFLFLTLIFSQELLEVRRLFDEANNMTQSYREDLNDTQDKLREAIELVRIVLFNRDIISTSFKHSEMIFLFNPK